MEYNKFIDFDSLFSYLIGENKDELDTHRFEADHYNDILNFVDHRKQDFELQIDECEYCDETVSFVFGHNNNDANESNNESSWSTFFILYNRRLHEFTICEYEQG